MHMKNIARRFAWLLALAGLAAWSPAVAEEGAGGASFLPDLGQAEAVDRLTFSVSALSGTQGRHDNTMALGSATFPFLFSSSGQVDLGYGEYRSDYTSFVAGGRMFWRYRDFGALGIYADYSYVNPEHVGRFGLEGSFHFDRITIDALVGFRTGTNVYTTGFDEIDATYYFTDDLKGSVGHRGTSRGHVANVAFEYAPGALSGWSVFGEAEMGEDDNQSAFAGVRYTFGGGRYASLIERDREGPMRIRAPRGIVDITRCGLLPGKLSASFGLREMDVLCASRDELEAEGAEEGKILGIDAADD